jgi:hypothetical protein
MTSDVRRLGALTEVVHAVVYFAPQVSGAYPDAGLKGFWRGYFAGRSAPLGEASPELVTALFAGFSPEMVARALPEVWSAVPPGRVLRARADGAHAALVDLLGGIDPAPAAELTGRAVASLELPGRPLAAANAALPRPDEPLRALWHDCTVLREHRGDGHLAAVMAAGLRWPEPHLLLAGLGRLDPRQQEHRGWSDAQWHDARQRLVARGLLADDGTATADGRRAYDEIERLTDELAAPAYDAVDREALLDALAPLADRVVAGEVVPFPNAMGLPRPG